MFPAIGRNNRILMLGLLLWALGEGLWFNLRSILMAQLGATPSQIGLVLTIGGIARVIVLIPGGWLADRYGTRGLMIASWLMGIVSAVMVALAPDWRWMIPGEVVYSASIFVIPALSSYVLQALPENNRAISPQRALTTVYASFSAGMIFSQPVGGLIADRFGIQSTYWVAAVIFIFSTFVILQSRKFPPPAREETSGSWRDLASNRRFMTTIPLVALISIILTMGLTFAPVFLFDVRGFALKWIGITAAFMAAGAVLWNLLLGRLAPRWGLAATQGLVGVAVVILLLSQAVPAVGLAFLLMGGFITFHSLTNAQVASTVPAARRGTAFGVAEMSLALGAAIAPRIAGTLYETSPQLPFMVSAAALPVSILLTIVLLRARRVRTASVPVQAASAVDPV